jgi:hypothetical protein
VIPFDHITAWRAEAPWVDDSQVEQDLVISRALVEIFSHPVLADTLARRSPSCTSDRPRATRRTSISSRPEPSPRVR